MHEWHTCRLQHGFRPNIATAVASYKLINEILVAMNNKM